MQVSEIRHISEIDFVFPSGFSFFEPFLRYFTKEILEIGGEAYVSRKSDGVASGLFLYDDYEKAGSIYTKSKEDFDYFYELRPFNYVFAEIETDLEKEVYDIYTMEPANFDSAHRFSYEIASANAGEAEELERFMALTHPGINKRWVSVALKNGDKCFMVRLDNEIAGVGWVSLMNGVGRLHSLYVKPQYRRMGMGDDILSARLLWLKSMRARLVFSEISRFNLSCSRIATKEHMQASGQVHQYFKKKPNAGAKKIKS